MEPPFGNAEILVTSFGNCRELAEAWSVTRNLILFSYTAQLLHGFHQFWGFRPFFRSQLFKVVLFFQVSFQDRPRQSTVHSKFYLNPVSGHGHPISPHLGMGIKFNSPSVSHAHSRDYQKTPSSGRPEPFRTRFHIVAHAYRTSVIRNVYAFLSSAGAGHGIHIDSPIMAFCSLDLIDLGHKLKIALAAVSSRFLSDCVGSDPSFE